MKTLNIFALLFFVAFVKTTRKMTTYDDIVQNFVQLHDPNVNALAKISQITESFNESNKGLSVFKTQIDSTCQNLDDSYSAFDSNVKKHLKNINDELENLKTHSNEIQDGISKNIKEQGDEQKKIKDAYAEIKKARDDIAVKEADLFETINILHRLRYLAQDELAGTHKLETQMKNFTIVNNHGVSFIQKSNLKQELKTIMEKTETTGKSLISTLLFLASNDDGHYADPKMVQKILDVLDKIIKRNEDKRNNLKNDFEKNSKSQREIISNSEELLNNLKDNAIKNQYQLSMNNKAKLMYQAELLQVNANADRRKRNHAFQQEICNKHRAMAANNLKQHQNSLKKIEAIRNDLA